MKKSDPLWFREMKMPARLRARLKTVFTLHRDGYVCWYRDATRFACGRKTPPAEVEAAWAEKKRAIDGVAPPVVTGSITLKLLAGMYIERQRHRVTHGRPKPLSVFTLQDQIRVLREFAKAIGAEREVAELMPTDFAAYAKQFDARAASSIARRVAYVKAMFAWGDEAGHCPAPRYGPDFIKPPEATRRDERIGKAKSYTAAEIQAVWKVARREERLWMALGLNCAFDNSDVSTLTWDVVDLKAELIDFRRRKTGKIRRVIPLAPRTLRLLRAYKKVTPDSPAVFQTADGHPLVRMRDKGGGRGTSIDHIAFRWTKLLQKAGLRPKPTRVTEEINGVKIRKVVWGGGSDGRGFRGLRTTFANSIPPGYGDERQIIMGHSHGNTFLNSYLEKVGTARLGELVAHVWSEAFKGRALRGRSG